MFLVPLSALLSDRPMSSPLTPIGGTASRSSVVPVSTDTVDDSARRNERMLLVWIRSGHRQGCLQKRFSGDPGRRYCGRKAAVESDMRDQIRDFFQGQAIGNPAFQMCRQLLEPTQGNKCGQRSDAAIPRAQPPDGPHIRIALVVDQF